MDGAKHVGMLKRGLKVGDKVHKEFELREGTGADYFAAEAGGAQSSRTITFQAALVAQQLVRIGTFEGPFTTRILGALHAEDLNLMIEARMELEASGEGEQPG